MIKFRKRPVVIDAFQMTQQRRQDNSEWPDWLHKAWNLPRGNQGSVFATDFPDSDGTERISIITLEGTMLVDWNDWIIMGVKGELYPCKPDIFEATYDLLDEGKKESTGKTLHNSEASGAKMNVKDMKLIF